MNQSIFSQAVDQSFPNLDEEIRTEIKNKVFIHMVEFLKEKIYANDTDGLKKFEQATKNEPTAEKRAAYYINQIFEKFASLSSEEQNKYDSEIDKELTRVMHEIYQAYE